MKGAGSASRNDRNDRNSRNGRRAWWIPVLLGVSFALLAEGSASPAPEARRRLVSICLPGDQLLLQLVPREEIAALSWLALDPDLSPRWREARGIVTTRGSAEELIRLKPDLVLTGSYSTPATNAMLKRMGVPVVEIGVPNNFEELRGQIRRVARALGARERGEAIIAAMDERLRRVTGDRAMANRDRKPTALLYFQDGYTPGNGTFAHAILEAAGFTNLGEVVSPAERASTPLEAVLMARPEFLILSSYQSGAPTFSEFSARHPVFRHLEGIEVITIAFRHLACPDSSNVELVEELHGQLLSKGGRP